MLNINMKAEQFHADKGGILTLKFAQIQLQRIH